MIDNYRPGWMNEELTALGDMVRRFVADEISPNQERWYEAGGGAVPILIFSSIVGYETMRPAIETLKGYRYAGVDRKKERKVIADTIIKMVGSS